ncbi:MAG: ATP-binding protein [Candidatus Cryosericum sp.]|nr:PAS domain-containing sensor histidine kinase [bacterium]
MIRGRPYALRILNAILIVGFLIVATATAGFIVSLQRQAIIDETGRLEASARLLANEYAVAVHSGVPADSLVHGTLPGGLRLTILDAKGSAIADSQVDPHLITNRGADTEVQQASANGRGTAVSYRLESGQRERTVCIALREGGSLAGFAVASSPVGLTWHTISSTLTWTLSCFLVISALWFLVGILLARMATRPLADLADALERRSLSSLAGLAMHADVSELGRAQKASYALLEESEALADREHAQTLALSAVLDAVPQAIAILDDARNVVSANTQFERLFGGGTLPVAGRNIAELVALPGILAAIERSIADDQEQTVVVEDHGHYYSCSVHRFDKATFPKRRTLVVLQDITDAVALPRIKADFVANASHELKTPLTAIRGYLELLREEPANLHYLDIIERNVERLIALSSDITLLSRLENKSPEIELVDMQELQRDLTELFDRQAHETGVALTFSIESEARFLYGDRLMLLQLFINLIENAYRFTTVGAISISATADSTHIIFTVADTGQGISTADLPRIFERFYSRSSDHGRSGTGLGLAIVKRIVLAHNGTITVQSVLGKGTIFVIHIPRNLGPRKPDTGPGTQSDTNREAL